MQVTSLKAKFISVIVLISLAVGGLTLFAFDTSTSGIIDDLALRFATKEALLEKNKVISVIEREVALARMMARDVTLRHWASDEGNRELQRAAFAELENYRTLYRDKSFFIALAASNHYYVYDKRNGHGRVEMVTLDGSKPHDRWFFEGLRSIDDYALNLDYNATLQEIKVWFNAAMTDGSGRKIGICGGGITISDFLNQVVHTRQKGLSTILMDRAGVVQAHEDRKVVEHNANTRDVDRKITIFTLMGDPAREAQVRGAIESLAAGRSEVEAFPVRFGGKSYLMAISFLEGMGWFNVVLVDVSRVISMKQFLPIIAVMSLSLLLGILAIGFLINRMVLTPLGRLSAASREIAAGRYDISLPVTGRDELGELTGSFNAMSAMVLDHTTNLEARVRERTDELSAANRLLEDSQRRIMESITYARMIQTSILPDRESLERCLGDHFILYRPKEPVGGDFYYLREFPDHFLLAVIDCTGHGIPGAFMTMTVNAVLNHVVDVCCNDDPSRILAELNRVLRNTLHLRDVDAGLDIALCMVERRAGRLTFAGAGLPLVLVSGGEVREVRGDHQRVGYRGSRIDYRYTNHVLTPSAGDNCYLTTDGLLDEPGGVKGYGFGSERLRKILADHAHLAMPAQAEAVEAALDAYRGDHRQRDDITLAGFRF